MNTIDEIKEIIHILFLKYGSLTLNTAQTVEVTQRSEMSLKRDRRLGVGIPYTKLGAKSGSDKALYNIADIAKYVVSKKIKTANS